MTPRPVIPRELARRDIEDAINHYAAEAGESVALGFVDALEAAFRAIVQRPAAGSPRIGFELNLPGLRSRPLRRFPYRVFYVEHDDRIDVWRVLHERRDIPAFLREAGR